jgi:hypothetical protein
MESTAPTMTPARRRMIQSIGESASRKSASQEEDALIFLFFRNSKHLRIHDCFFQGGKSMGILFE